MSLTIDCHLTEFEAIFSKLASEVYASVRPSAQAGAQVLYEEVRRRVPQSKKPHYFYGTAARKAPKGMKQAYRYGPYNPGDLRAAIYQAFSKDNSTARGNVWSRASYHISWNHKKVPYGFMVERGTRHSAARPFVRSSAAAIPSALDAMRARLRAELEVRSWR